MCSGLSGAYLGGAQRLMYILVISGRSKLIFPPLVIKFPQEVFSSPRRIWRDLIGSKSLQTNFEPASTNWRKSRSCCRKIPWSLALTQAYHFHLGHLSFANAAAEVIESISICQVTPCAMPCFFIFASLFQVCIHNRGFGHVCSML